jgi:protein ImuA
MKSSFTSPDGGKRAEIMHELRGLMPRQNGIIAADRILPFGLPELDACLPQGGLSLAAIHEITPMAEADGPAAFGFIAALIGGLPDRPVIFVTLADKCSAQGRLHGHGLNSLGLDPEQVIIVTAADQTQALWAMEEALRSEVPAAVSGTAGAKLDLLAGQRLHLAAVNSGIPLLLLRPAGLPGVNVAMTRWRIGAAPAARDRFGLATHWRWHLRLERCRNGRTGEWLVEFDHAAYRFSLPAAMAHPAFSRRAGAQSVA